MKNKIFFLAAHQIENTGDLLINKAVLDLMRPYGEIFIDDMGKPAWFIDSIGHQSDRRLSEITKESATSYLFNSISKGLFSKSRSSFKYYLVFPPGHTSRRGKKAALKALRDNMKLHLLKMLGCRIVRMGFTIGPFDAINAFVESNRSSCHYYYGVRDQDSYSLAVKNRFSKVSYFPDLAWSYLPPSQTLSSEREEDYVVLSFRSNTYGTEHDSKYLSPIIDMLKSLLSKSELAGRKVYVAYQVQYDREASVEIVNKLSPYVEIELVDNKLMLDEANKLYQNAYCILSNRLHVLLLASQNDTLAIPLINFIDNKKITSIYKDNDLGDVLLSLDDSEVENTRKLNNSLVNRVGVIGKFASVREKNVMEIKEKVRSVFRKII